MHPSEDDENVEREMPRYQSHKKVWALEINAVAITHGGTNRSLSFKDRGYAAKGFAIDDAIFSRYMPVPGDFYVVYDDGYKSFSPRKAFLEGYTKL